MLENNPLLIKLFVYYNNMQYFCRPETGPYVQKKEEIETTGITYNY